MSTLKNHWYIWTWHSKKDYARQLYKETDFKHSSLWWFRAQWWNSSSSPTNIAYNTTEWYVYSSSWHSQLCACPLAADYSTFQNCKAVKVVCDWVLLWNNNNSLSSIFWLCDIAIRKNSSWIWGTYTSYSWDLPTPWNWYRAEAILKKWENPVLTLENWWTFIRNNVDFDYLVSQSAWRWFTTWNLSHHIFFLNLDQWTTSKLKDIHVYLGY